MSDDNSSGVDTVATKVKAHTKSMVVVDHKKAKKSLTGQSNCCSLADSFFYLCKLCFVIITLSKTCIYTNPPVKTSIKVEEGAIAINYFDRYIYPRQ